MTDRNSIVKMRKIFLSATQKFSLKIPYCYQEIVTIPKRFHSFMKSMTLFPQSQNPPNFVRII